MSVIRSSQSERLIAGEIAARRTIPFWTVKTRLHLAQRIGTTESENGVRCGADFYDQFRHGSPRGENPEEKTGADRG
jgi:hypothetical protein